MEPTPTEEAPAARQLRYARSLAADMANLAQTLTLSLSILEMRDVTDDEAAALADARSSADAFCRTLRAAHHLIADEPRQIEASAAGWVHVAVAVARAEGVGIRLDARSPTTLRVTGLTTDIARTLEDLIVGLGATRPRNGHVEVDLVPDGVNISAPLEPALLLDSRVRSAVALAHRFGWDAVLSEEATHTTVRIRAAHADARPNGSAEA